MKDITSCINEALLNESSISVSVVVYHNKPADTHVIYNVDPKKAEVALKRLGVDYTIETLNPADKLIFLWHSDQNPYMTGVPALPQLKKACWDEYQQCPEEPEFNTLGVGELGIYDEVHNANDLWKVLEDWIKYSEVDRDSSSVYALIDPYKKETIVAGYTNILSYDSLQDFLHHKPISR